MMTYEATPEEISQIPAAEERRGRLHGWRWNFRMNLNVFAVGALLRGVKEGGCRSGETLDVFVTDEAWRARDCAQLR